MNPMTITRTAAGTFEVATGVYMSDHTYQNGTCRMVSGNVLRFPGEFNRRPFRVNLGPKALAAVQNLEIGQSVIIGR